MDPAIGYALNTALFRLQQEGRDEPCIPNKHFYEIEEGTKFLKVIRTNGTRAAPAIRSATPKGPPMKTSSRPAPRLPANWKQGFTFPHSIPAHEEPFLEDGAWKVYANEARTDGIVRIKYNFQTDLFEH